MADSKQQLPPLGSLQEAQTLPIREDVPLSSTAAESRLAAEARAFRLSPTGTTNITAAFNEASSKLAPGQLIKDPNFTLFEAVGALEIMDPKMDSGVIPEGDTLEPDFDPAALLTPAQVIGIMDRLIMLESAWHAGSPLGQTIFTSLHVFRLLDPRNRAPYDFDFGEGFNSKQSTQDDAAKVTQEVLRIFCIVLIRTINAMLAIIQRQTYFEEEDFSTHLFGLELLPELDGEEMDGMLNDSLVLINTTFTFSEDVRHAFKARLQFRFGILAAIEECDVQWGHISGSSLIDIEHTHVYGEDVPEAFSHKVERQLDSTTPPRPPVQVVWSDCLRDWRIFCSDLHEAHRIIETPFFATDSHRLLTQMWQFAYRSPQPSTFPRAELQEMLLGGQTLASGVQFHDLIIMDMREKVFGTDHIGRIQSFMVEVPDDIRYICARLIEKFADMAYDQFAYLYRMPCLNRSRTRRGLVNAISMWEDLEREAIPIDAKIEKVIAQSGSRLYKLRPFRQLELWSRYHKYNLMILALHLGFETSIYLPDELSFQYAFLSLVYARQRALISGLPPGARTPRLLVQTEACFHLAQALSLFTNILTTTKLITAPPRTHITSERALYEARIRPFLYLKDKYCRYPFGAPLPGSELLVDDGDGSVTYDSILRASERVTTQATQARVLLSQLKEVPAEGKVYDDTASVQELARVCLAVSLTTKTFETAVSAAAVEARARSNGGQPTSTSGTSESKQTHGVDLRNKLACNIPSAYAEEEKVTGDAAKGKRYHPWWSVPHLWSVS